MSYDNDNVESGASIKAILANMLPGQFRVIAPLKKIEYGVYGDLIVIYPKPSSIYLMGDYRV